MLFCTLLPAGAPDAVEARGEAREELAGLRAEPVRRAIDQDREARRRGDMVEPEEGEDAVDVHEQGGRCFGGGH
jgi:hypothetical protein